jgi:DNA mismatch endonuclease (patch repair protein)
MIRSRSAPTFKGLRSSSTKASATASASSRKRDTSCEIILRKELSRLGLRYRIATDSLPGKPDVVFVGPRVAVFCDGDFWHGRDLAARIKKLEAGHNAPYWVAKIRTNVERDGRQTRFLETAGWFVLRFWESDIQRDAAVIAARIAGVVARRRRSGR